MTKTGSRKHLAFQIAFFAGAILINFLLPRAAGALHIPLYLDNVGTLLAAILGGYLPGIAIGYLNNIINMQGNPGNAYYVVLSTMIAASGTFLARKGWFDKIWKAILTIPVFAFIGGALGSLLTYFLYGYGLGEGHISGLQDGARLLFRRMLCGMLKRALPDHFLYGERSSPSFPPSCSAWRW